MTGTREPRIIDGTYELEESLGAGAMGSVHRVRHVHLDKTFALKLINPSVLARRHGRRRFEIEARALGRLTHPNIVRVTDYGIDDRDETPFLVMEHLTGEILSEVVKRDGPLPPERALPILQAVAEGLDYAHSQGVLHRDLKPHNIFVSRDPSGLVVVKIVDFGLARMSEPLTATGTTTDGDDSAVTWTTSEVADPAPADVTCSDRPRLRLSSPVETRSPDATVLDEAAEASPDGATIGARTRAGAVVGTAAYMAPEIADGRGASEASDLYSLGVLAFEMMVGRRPFKGGYANVLRAHVFDDPPSPSALEPGLPLELDAALLSALAKDPSRRPPSAQAFVGGLRRALASARERAWFRRELPRRSAIGLILTVMTLVAAAGLRTWSVVGDLEHRLLDLRFSLAEPIQPHPGLAIVYLDDATLDADPLHRPTTAYADEFGTLLAAALDRGATGVGLDIEVPRFWSDSSPFFRLLAEHPERVALAIHSAEDETLVGSEVAEGPVTLALGPERAAGLFGYANLIQDRDGTIRRFALGYSDLHGRWHPTLASRIAGIVAGQPPTETGDLRPWVDYRVDWHAIPTWSWFELEGLLRQRPSPVSGRFVLVGGLIQGFGDEHYPVPHPGSETVRDAPGVVLQALMVNTILNGNPIEAVPIPRWLMLTSSLGLALMAVLWLHRLSVALTLVGLFLAAYAALAVWVFVTAGVIVPIASMLVVLPPVSMAAVVVRLRLPDRPRE